MRFSILILAIASFAFSSCGLVRSAVQLPVRTIQSVTRAAGVGLTATEITPNQEAGTEEENH